MTSLLTINPDKCQIGLNQVTYVGHTLDATGIHFERTKLDGVYNFPKPVYSKHLKSFVSLASYFRDHVQNHASRVKPLFDLLTGYDKNKRIQWTPEAEAAFEDIREGINNCPKLFFLDDTSPICLHTDASDYGIGAYLFQIVNGQEVPIHFISKSLDTRQQNWTTAEKEGYAIFYALDKLEYLLRDREFVLRTDHDNLRLLKEKYGANQKVQRWFKAFMSYDFTIEHIKGSLNEIADSFSRLCAVDAPTEESRLCMLQDFKIPNTIFSALGKVHNDVVGHHGVDRTVAKLRAL